MGKYTEFSENLLGLVGGSENVDALTHCFTRLRFILKDEEKVDEEGIKQLDGVVTLIKSYGQYQVVIGNHVPEVYKEICEIGDIKDESVGTAENKKSEMSIQAKFIDFITGAMLPSISILSACGILKGLNSILQFAGIYSAESGYATLLSAIGDTYFFFFPVVLGYNTAKKLKGNPYLGMAIGLALCYPTIQGVDISLFGLNINATYTSSVLPSIIIVALAVQLEKFLNRVIPNAVSSFLTPAIVLVISVPLGFMLIGPAANWMGEQIGNIVNSVINISPVLGGIIIGGLWQPFVIFGFHNVLCIPSIMNVVEGRPDWICSLNAGAGWAFLAVLIVIWMKTKDQNLKKIALPAWISAFFGVTEPGTYGVALPRLKMFVIACIGGSLGGAVAGFLNMQLYSFTGMGPFSIASFINPDNPTTWDFIRPIIVWTVSFIFSFIVAYIVYKDKDYETVEKKEKDFKQNAVKDEIILSPVKGNTIDLSKVDDAAFSQGVLGKGIAIEPVEGNFYAPVSGTVMTVFPTKHTVGLISDTGCEVLIHIGTDTVELNGKYFTAHVKQGDKVAQGDLLISCEIESIKSEGFSTITPIIISNTKDYLDVIEMTDGEVNVGSKIIACINN